MEALALKGHLGRRVDIDVCHPCQAFWFDRYESLQLAPSSVLHLFRVIGQAGGVKAPLSENAGCPRCGQRLKLVKDMQRQTRFEYLGCRERHGRLTSFFNFLREKDFIRPLSAMQIEALRRKVQSVNCSNCGAPVDLAKGTACAHCGSPLSMLDLEQAEALVAKLRDAGARHEIKPDAATLAIDLERARQKVDSAFAAFERNPGWYGRASTEGLVGAALGAFTGWLNES